VLSQFAGTRASQGASPTPGYHRRMHGPQPPVSGQMAPEAKSRDRLLALAIFGGLLLIAGLLIAGATHNVRSVLVPIGTVVSLTGLTCLLTGGTLYIARGRASRQGIPTHQLPPPGWYIDSAGVTCWWDGTAWSSFTAPPPPDRT
jgi:hypothetical protein